MERVNETLQSLAESRTESAKQEQQRNEALSRRTEDVISGLSGHQENMAAQVRQFAAELGAGASKQQEESVRLMNGVVEKVLQDVSASMAALQSSREAAARQDQARNEALTRRTEEVIGELSRQLSNVAEVLAAQITRAQSNIDALQNVSIRAIDGMNNGATTMNTAAQRFETAGASVANVFDKSSSIANELHRTSAALQTASSAVAEAFQHYNRTRGTVQEYVGILTTLVQSAQTETGLTRAMVADLEKIVQSLRDAERQATDYLDGVNLTLIESFKQFGDAMTNQLTKTIGQTDRPSWGRRPTANRCRTGAWYRASTYETRRVKSCYQKS